MRIGEAARTAGLMLETVPYDKTIRLLPAPRRRPSGYRHYPEDAVERLRVITEARLIGLSLGEVGDVLAAGEPGQVGGEHMVQVFEAQRDRIEE